MLPWLSPGAAEWEVSAFVFASIDVGWISDLFDSTLLKSNKFVSRTDQTTLLSVVSTKGGDDNITLSKLDGIHGNRITLLLLRFHRPIDDVQWTTARETDIRSICERTTKRFVVVHILSRNETDKPRKKVDCSDRNRNHSNRRRLQYQCQQGQETDGRMGPSLDFFCLLG